MTTLLGLVVFMRLSRRSCCSPWSSSATAPLFDLTLVCVVSPVYHTFSDTFPAFWRIVLGINLVYELPLVFLLFQDLGSARQMMTLLDENLGVPLKEQSLREDCTFSVRVIWVGGRVVVSGLIGDGD